MTTQPKAALTGVRVLDLSRVLAGPWSTQILGDLGAEVIKVEKPGRGDDTRGWGPPFLPGAAGKHGDAAYYLCANRNKRSITIDFAKPEGADLVRRLVPHCHIVVENFKTGGLTKYGLDYERLAAINPALVYCSITGFGQSGPYAKRPGYDYMIQAMGGLMSLTGEPDGEPIKSAAPVADLFTGMYAVTGILAALRHAERTGEGQHIDVALLECQIAMLANLAMSCLATGQSPARVGNAHASVAPYQVFPTADGHMVIAVGNDGQFRDLCTATGLTLADDPRFATNEARVANRPALSALLSEAARQRPTTAWLPLLAAAEVPCGPINTLPEMFADPHVQARGVVQHMTRADGVEVALTASPLHLSATPASPRIAPPPLGADTEDVLGALLGAAPSEIDAWRQGGVI